jgi:hypothetical protein
MAEAITLAERGREIRFTYDDMVRFHGHGSPGGVAHGFKMLQRALPLLDPAAPQRGRTLERFVFRLAYRERTVTLAARAGSVPDELIALARVEQRTPAQEARLDVVKLATAEAALAMPASDVYEVLG